MGGQIVRSELYGVWGMFLAMLFGGTNSMSVQKLYENNKSMKLYCDYLLFIFYLGMVLGIFVIDNKNLPQIRFVAMALNVLLATKSLEQWRVAALASKPSSENGIKRLVLYMKHEHELSTSYDPRTMQGYKYAVLIHEGCDELGEGPITLEKIWSDNIGVLSSSNNLNIHRLKDLCLSFSLFHLVVRRYFGYACPESKLDKSRHLVLDGLLRTECDSERAFQVIEAELAFLYDFFFTKYAYIMYGREIKWCALSLATTFVSIAVGTWSLCSLNMHHSNLDDNLVETSTQDFMVTKIVFAVLSTFQLLQIWSYCASDWANVSLVCKYARHPSWHGNACIEKLLLLLGRPHKWLRYWRNTIGQYSVLDSFSSSYWARLKHHLPRGKAGKPKELTMEVKRAIAHTIKHSVCDRLSHGASALMKHHMSNELHWACEISDEFTLIHSILVWHVATSYYEISEADTYTNQIYMHSNQKIAISLSRYCAYLVAFAPTLLPSRPMETTCILDDFEQEAKEQFQNLVSPKEKYEKLRELHNGAGAGGTMVAELLTKGAIIGKTIEGMGNRMIRWDLLADFWAEMLVYIAPSDNVAGHIELLAEGGEFVTHVWALLMHAGILERPAAAATAVP
ncbi:uncharacterized protein [Aegilops tauschii subsp. strangulata]|nr:uncharacterized protein LOC109748414 [Aegilops tauschii subsp. strangulata]